LTKQRAQVAVGRRKVEGRNSNEASVLTISQEDKERLRSFVEQAKHLESHSLIKGEQLRAKWTLSWKRGEEAKLDTHSVDYEALESILTRLRRFVMTNDAVHLPRVVKVLKRDYPDNRDFLASITDSFLIRQEYGMINIEAGGQAFGEEALFQDFINSHVFHADAERKERLAALGNIVEDKMAYTILLSAVVVKVNAVRALRAFIEKNVDLS
jgi:hypothetical protein